MPDPHAALSRVIGNAIEAAFGADHADVDPVLRPATNPKFGDYQANVAMPLGKTLGRDPREIAAEIVSHLETTGLCSSVEVAGPGFINLRLDDAWLAGEVEALGNDDRLGVGVVDRPETIIVDYSGPNLAKEMHVGHLRSTIIGDALARVFRSLGHRTIAQNHIGDWGTPFGMLIEHMVDLSGTETLDQLSVADLNDFYQQARTKFDDDPAFADRARARVVALQAGEPRTLHLWSLLVEESKRHFREVYDRLGILLSDDDIAGESSFNDELDDVADDLTAKGLARVDDGALCAFPPGFTGRDGEPLPLIVRKSDGGYGYAATDLAALRHRVRDLHAARLVYVVGAPQAMHLAMVFAVGAQAGWLHPSRPEGPRAEHVSFGSVLGPDGKMFKTRRGESIKLADLLDEAVDRAAGIVADKNPDLPIELKSEVAHAVGIGAVKYADLASDRVKDYVFDWDRMLSFDGNTAAYLQNAYVRVRSIFRRAEIEAGDVRTATVTLGAPEERALALALVRFEGVVVDVADTLQPHRLCTYLFDLAQAFTAFYEKCPVLRADDTSQRTSRLALCDVTARVLQRGLGLLGIETVEQM
jgi:arginyl-tRNA synthetase